MQYPNDDMLNINSIDKNSFLSINIFHRGRSSVGLERLPVTQEAASSSLVAPAIIRKNKNQLLFIQPYPIF